MLGVLPRVINDDEYVRRQIPAGQVTFVPQCSFVARVPRTFTDLLKVRRRVHRGNRQLAQMGGKADKETGSSLGLVSLALAPAAPVARPCRLCRGQFDGAA